MINGDKVILIHPDLNDIDRHWVCAYELNHGIQHPTTNALFLAAYTYFRFGTLENEAEIGAADLLLSDEKCYKYIGMEYKTIAYEEKIPEIYVEVKMKNFRKRMGKVMK